LTIVIEKKRSRVVRNAGRHRTGVAGGNRRTSAWIVRSDRRRSDRIAGVPRERHVARACSGSNRARRGRRRQCSRRWHPTDAAIPGRPCCTTRAGGSRDKLLTIVVKKERSRVVRNSGRHRAGVTRRNRGIRVRVIRRNRRSANGVGRRPGQCHRATAGTGGDGARRRRRCQRARRCAAGTTVPCGAGGATCTCRSRDQLLTVVIKKERPATVGNGRGYRAGVPRGHRGIRGRVI
jgi:hypothetical protein